MSPAFFCQYQKDFVILHVKPGTMRLRVRVICIVLAAAMMLSPLTLCAKGWEPVKSEYSEAKIVSRDSQIEVRSQPGMIIVSVGQQTQIKIFTILGRLVNSETLPAGTLQYTVPAHGVYIVKAGDITCKVAV